LNLLQAIVKQVQPQSKTLLLENGIEMAYDHLILATGSRPKYFGWPGQELRGVQGFYTLQDLQQLEQLAPGPTQCKHAVIVGGGLIGIEVAEMLNSRDIPVTLLVREPAFWNNVLPNCDSEHLNQHIRDHQIDLKLNTQLQEILGAANGRVGAVVTDSGEQIACDLVVLCTGVTPNIEFLKGSGLELDHGILVNGFLETSVPGIYAIGDCAQLRNPQPGRRATEAVWYVGRAMGQTVAQTICGKPTSYQPGNWYNSAKFLDIEYQTYGLVSADTARKADHQVFHWKHPKKEQWITLEYHIKTSALLGINAFGLRLRHEVLERWISAKLPVQMGIQKLQEALFNPEFTPRVVPYIQNAFLEHQQKSL
jgi:NAD(P)H-nitrite reductase large subunit